MTESQALALFKCLGDKSRLQILKSLAQEDMYVERLAERLGLTPPTISFHLKKLSDAGAVRSYKTQYYTMYALETAVFEQTMLSLIREESAEADLQRQRDEAYRQKVIRSFFHYGKLRSIPTQKKKERIVLEEIVRAFEAGRDYTEREVNIILADFHDDFCTLRRDLIGEGLMTRENQIYRRTDA
ncbi:MAG: metalloregulator ArsR/SmtB family transcription factor [Clostridia bacterium]|nr:metalloregulator ArsR/SmtB family transcription factor [Clostridia bacterium]